MGVRNFCIGVRKNMLGVRKKHSGVRNCIKIGQATRIECIGLIQFVSGLFFMHIGRYSLYAYSIYSKMIEAVVFVHAFLELIVKSATTI